MKILCTPAILTLLINTPLIGISGNSLGQLTTFKENKGQVYDQKFNAKPDVLFYGMTNNMTYHLKTKGVSYQLYHSITSGSLKREIKSYDEVSIHRLDINWLGCNVSTEVKKGKSLPGYDNYYTPICPNGVINVQTYEAVIYENIYAGIDLHYYNSDNELKYDYIVGPKADYKLIRLQIEGAGKIQINQKGELVIETPLGKIIEQAPLVTQNGKVLKARWKLNNNVVSFDITDANPNYVLIIDPVVRVWGTYCGGADDEYPATSCFDNGGNVFITGASRSISSIATSGAFQTVINNTTINCGYTDAFLIKFDGNGNKLWGTYYGDGNNDEGYGVCSDNSGNVFMTGYCLNPTTSASVIATPGSFQSNWSGSRDAFLVKFDNNGIRVWGTYYGAGYNDEGNSCKADGIGNVYLVGSTDGSANSLDFATMVAHQTTFGGGRDAFVAKFDNSGNRIWGTFYGGYGIDEGYSCSIDPSGNVYLLGNTTSTLGISTSGSHQDSYGGGVRDAFLVKINSSGVRQWATYYGGSDMDEGFSCTADNSGNIFFCGDTYSTNNISTPGAFKTIVSGLDAYLIKFNTNGVRQWGTYYGDANTEIARSCAGSSTGDIYMCGQSDSFMSGNSIATSGSHQDSLGGVDDAFLVKFNSSGTRQWGTFYGGEGLDWGYSCTVDLNSNIYLFGLTESMSANTIATPGSYQSSLNGNFYDVFLTKFTEMTTAVSQNKSKGLDEFSVFPNPSSGVFTLHCNLISNELQMEIYNRLGEIVEKRHIQNKNTVIDLSGFSSGIYLILVKNGLQTLSCTKVVKQ